jgi:nucleoside-diphosphate-sugar epimerase
MDVFGRRTVLITGGHGFIGLAAGEALRSTGFRAISADLNSVNVDRQHGPCDITDVAQVRDLFHKENIDAVVHLAAILPTAAQRDPERATAVNVAGSLNLLEAAREFGVRRFVLGSSLSVYGTYPADQVVSESDRATPEDLYGASKVYVEQLGEAYRQAHGLEFVSLRIGRVVGPGSKSNTSAWRSQIFEYMDQGSGEIVIPYADAETILLVHVKDVGRMLSELVRASQLRHTVYNAACESVVVGELKSEIERLNPQVRVRLEGQSIARNPRRVDWSRFEEEFGFELVPLFERLAKAGGK